MSEQIARERVRFERVHRELVSARAENARLRAALDELNADTENLFSEAARSGDHVLAITHMVRRQREVIADLRAKVSAYRSGPSDEMVEQHERVQGLGIGVGRHGDRPVPSPGRRARVLVTITKRFDDGRETVETQAPVWPGYTAKDLHAHWVRRGRDAVWGLVRDGRALVKTRESDGLVEIERFEFEDMEDEG